MIAQLPTDVAEYKRTAEFDETTVPGGLKRSHRLKAGVWGEIIVTVGRVRYVVESGGDSTVLDSAHPGVIAPEAPHHVELEPGARFYVRFLRRG